MILSRGDRDLWVAFQTHPGSQASSRVEAKNSALLSSCDRYLLEPTEWPKGSQASGGVLREDSGLLSRPCRKRRASFHDDGQISWFFLSCGATFGVFLELQWGTKGASRVAPGKSSLDLNCEGSAALLSIHCRVIPPQDALKGESRGLSQVAAGNPGILRIMTVTSGSFLLCLLQVRNTVDWERASRTPLGLMQWKSASSRIEV